MARWFSAKFGYLREPNHFGHIAAPLFMGFFGILYLFWGFVTATFVWSKIKSYYSILGIEWQDQIMWACDVFLTSFEIYAIYLVFEIIFLKPLSLESNFIESWQYFAILHMYYGMLVCVNVDLEWSYVRFRSRCIRIVLIPFSILCVFLTIIYNNRLMQQQPCLCQ